MQKLKAFITNKSGTTAVIFGLAIIPIFGSVGVAVDYSRAHNTRAALQKAADATALQVVTAKLKGRTVDFQDLFNTNFTRQFTGDAPRLTGTWELPNERFRVTADIFVPTTIAGLFMPQMTVSVAATAVTNRAVNEAKIEGYNLSPEAADYNELFGYCYRPLTGERLGPLDPKTGERLPFLKIADNSDDGVAALPKNLVLTCDDNENQSLQLRNVREARTEPAKRLTNPTYNYYTDTTMETSGPEAGIPAYNTNPPSILESILCANLAECKPRADGGILPNNHEVDRTPAVNKKACSKGSLVYFGWEDRPPGAGWTDRDYDDIRLVMTCPDRSAKNGIVRLVE
jgi:hypothetical protein